jgi:hypothetical protein
MLVGLLLEACAPPPGLVGAPSETDAHAAVLTTTGADTLACAAPDGADLHRRARGDIGWVDGADDATVTVRGLLADTVYTCVAEGSDGASEPLSLTTPALPAALPLPAVTVAGDDAEVGFHLVNLARLTDPESDAPTTFTDEFLVLFDAEGHPRWQLAGEGGGDIDATWLPDGRILYGGYGGDTSTAPTIVNLDGAVEWRAEDTLSSAGQVAASWHHDAGLASDGASVWALTQEFVPLEEDPESTWEGFVVQQIDLATGGLRWSWSSAEDGVAQGALAAGGRGDTSPFHANAVWDAEEADGAKVYVSLRNPDQVLRIDVVSRQADLVIGVGGDLTLLAPDGTPAPDEDWFFGQHDAKRVGDRLIVYDNGFSRTAYGAAAYSRALVLLLDEAAGTARIETAWRDDPDWTSPAWGGLDRRADGRLDLAIGNFWWADRESTQRSALALLEPIAARDAAVRWRLDFSEREIALYRSDRVDPCAVFGLVSACP